MELGEDYDDTKLRQRVATELPILLDETALTKTDVQLGSDVHDASPKDVTTTGATSCAGSQTPKPTAQLHGGHATQANGKNNSSTDATHDLTAAQEYLQYRLQTGCDEYLDDGICVEEYTFPGLDESLL